MEITLHYKDFEVYGEVLDDDQPYGCMTPRTTMGTSLMDYDYTVTVDEDDIFDYLVDQIGRTTFKGWSQDQKNGFSAAIHRAYLCNIFFVEDVDDFIEWLKDKHEDDAREQCHADYDD